MSRWNLILLLLIVGPILYTGCSMCCGPYDYEYPMMESTTYPRIDPEYGRVGSIFSDPNVGMGSVPRTNADLPVETPESANDLEDDGLDDPDFDNDIQDTLPGPDDPSINPQGDIDTSASLERMPRRRWLRR